MQFDNVLFANWITYCGGYNTTRAMLYDTNPNTLLQHNGDICYAQVSHLFTHLIWIMSLKNGMCGMTPA